MAVFTEVSNKEARDLLRRLQLGKLTELRGIEGGIENTNYFLTSDEGEYVLTLFERLTAEQLPFYLYLMKHLAHGGIPVPDPAADKSGDILLSVAGKPAAVVNKLRGKSQLAPQAVHCAAVGATLARMHLVGRDYERQQPNLRGLPWWNQTVPVVVPHIDAAQRALLESELAYQNHVAGMGWKAQPEQQSHVQFCGGGDDRLLKRPYCLHDQRQHQSLDDVFGFEVLRPIGLEVGYQRLCLGVWGFAGFACGIWRVGIETAAILLPVATGGHHRGNRIASDRWHAVCISGRNDLAHMQAHVHAHHVLKVGGTHWPAEVLHGLIDGDEVRTFAQQSREAAQIRCDEPIDEKARAVLHDNGCLAHRQHLPHRDRHGHV